MEALARKNILCSTMYSIVQKLSIKQSVEVICRFDRLRTAHNKGQKTHMNIEKIIICPRI